ncbi:MAG: molybdopterin-containing oxidoreductase family protein [Terriglobales bacterium]
MAAKIVHAACPHDCPDACGVLITVEDGRATRIQGDPDHPVTRGFLCAKVAKYLDRVYSPDRVLHPYRRVGPKGSRACNKDDFRRISWDEALDEIVTRFHDIVRCHGAEAILPYSYGGTLGVLNGASMDRRFFHRLGASQLDRTICSITGELGIKSVYGLKLGTEPEQFARSRYIIAWGANIHGNNVHLWPFIEQARHHGAKLVVIDPYRTRTAACADWYLPINPGTDVALALGIMHVIINEGLFDAGYIARHTFGFDQLRSRVQQYPPERVARWTGISSDDIVKLARQYATTRPAAIRLNYGIQRSENGGMAVRAVCMLPCLIGSWKEVGGGLQLSTSESHNLNKDALRGAELMSHPARVINMVELGRALNDLQDPPVQGLFVYNSNPAAVAPNHNAVVRGLSRPDLFTVVHEQFFTDTTDYADIVLPATTFFEHKDLQTGYGHYFIQISNQAIEPLGECRSNVELFRALAQRMGFEDPCFRESDDDMIDLALASPHPHLEGIDRARLERDHFVRLNLPVNGVAKVSDPSPNQTSTRIIPSEATEISEGAQSRDLAFSPYLPFANGFPTHNGKALLYNESLVAQGLDPVATFTPPRESRHVGDARYPLELLARKCDNYLNSTFSNLPAHQDMENPGLLEINAADAATRGIHDGDSVRVFNSRGEILLTARVNGATNAGVVAARLNWAKLTGQARNINVLTSERLTDMGGGATFYSTLVDVARADG